MSGKWAIKKRTKTATGSANLAFVRGGETPTLMAYPEIIGNSASG